MMRHVRCERPKSLEHNRAMLVGVRVPSARGKEPGNAGEAVVLHASKLTKRCTPSFPDMPQAG